MKFVVINDGDPRPSYGLPNGINGGGRIGLKRFNCQCDIFVLLYTSPMYRAQGSWPDYFLAVCETL